MSVYEIPLFLQEISFQEPCLITNPSVKKENMMITEQEKEENCMKHHTTQQHYTAIEMQRILLHKPFQAAVKLRAMKISIGLVLCQ